MQHSELRKINSIFIFGFAVLATLYYGEGFLIPFTFAAFLAALMQPVSAKLEQAGLSKIMSALLSTLTVFIVVGALSFLFVYQLKIFTDDLPQIREQLKEFLQNIQQQISSSTGLSPEEQKSFLQDRSGALLESVEEQLTKFIGGIVSASLKFLLVLVYLFLFLLNREKYVRFILKYVRDEKDDKATEIMEKTSKVAHHYLWGRLIIMTILAIMYIITFTIFDIRYALLLTIFGALITIIPYIGPFISGVLPVIFAIVFGMDLSQVLIFAGIILIIQLIESYILEPVILGSEVQLSPLAVIIAIIIGGAVWGIAGMILFVPLFAVCKILFDYTTNLKPIGFLIGNEQKSGDGFSDKVKNMFTGSDG